MTENASKELYLSPFTPSVPVPVPFYHTLGYDADEATSGREALAVLQTKDFDLIFMDVQMPEMDGLEATRNIRARYANRNLAIVALTADGDRDACLANGMNEHMNKPISIKTLKAMIDGLFIAA